MKVGDLVKCDYRGVVLKHNADLIGIVIEVGAFGMHANRDTRVMWEDGRFSLEKSFKLEIIDESR